MIITIRLYAIYRERAGTNRIELEVPPGATVEHLVQKVCQRFPSMTLRPDTLMVAVNAEYALLSQTLREGDDVALIPPVAGGAIIEVTERELVPQDIVDTLKKDKHGAVVTFMGVVRDFDDGRRLVFLEYEAFKDMAEKKLLEIAEAVKKRWHLDDVALCHRTGRLRVGEISLVAAVAAPHRKEAFEACQYAVEVLKEIVPIWKKEVWEGGAAWVEAERT